MTANFPTWQHRFTGTRPADSLTSPLHPVVYLTVTAGLHYLAGNDRPYYSVTADAYEPGYQRRPFLSGHLHEDVVRVWPELQPVLALHLSDDRGIPMHAEANGWYWLAGYYGGAGEPYHGGHARHPQTCLEIFASLMRVSPDSAAILADTFRCAKTISSASWADVRALFHTWIQDQLPRWQDEADRAIVVLERLRLQHAAPADTAPDRG